MGETLASFPKVRERRNVLVEDETTKDGKTAIQRNGLRDRKAAHAQRKSQRSKRAQRHYGDTGEERATHVEILVVLSRSPHITQGTNDATGVQRGSSQ
jgi:hypothetical protein